MADLAFLGSPEVSAVALRALVAAGHHVALVVTEPDRRRGRGGALTPTPVKAAALELGLTLSETVADVKDSGAELGVVVAFGRIIKPDVFKAVPMVNVHFSLLPRWRGAAPVERAILAGDEVTGVCLMVIERELDTGGVYARVETPIGPTETADELRERLGVLGAGLLVDRLRDGRASLGAPQPQVGEVTYAEKLSPSDRHLPLSRPAELLVRVVRIGRAWTTWRGKRLFVHEAMVDADPVAEDVEPGTFSAGRIATGDGWLVPRIVQAEGRSQQDFGEWIRGARLAEGEQLGTA
jgi:methionyl-tRNA formyltransferase